MRISSKLSKLIGKYMNRVLLVVLLLSQVTLIGFVEFDSDNLYSYQWGLKNNGNFCVDRTILSNNHSPIFFNKDLNDLMFFDNKEILDYFRPTANMMSTAYSTCGFDINWEEGFVFFKNQPAQRNATIAIIDTGIDVNHFELSDSIWVNEDEIPSNGIDDDKNGYVDDINGYNFHHNNNLVYVDSSVDVHGTHAAGIIVAKHNNRGTKGIAYDPNIKIMPLKVLDANQNGFVSSVVSAIEYAKKNGANICNLSLGSYKYESKIDEAIRKCPEMVFVVSAGNGVNYNGCSLDERDVYPAKLNYSNIITVSNASFEKDRYVSANFGSYVDIFAPGTFILSTAPENNFAYLTGTSMSAPFVSAVCAMIYSRFPNAPIALYKNIIINGATPVDNLLGYSKSVGLLNVYNSLFIASNF